MSSQRGPKDERGERVSALILAAREYNTAAVMFHNAIAVRFGLSVTDLKALDLLQRVGSLTAGDIAMRTGLATASVTSLIDRLQQKGFVKRATDPAGDRRRVLVALTPKLDKAIAPLFESLGQRMLARLSRQSDAEIDVIGEFLKRGAQEMREEATKLPSKASVTRASRHASGRRDRGRGP